MMHTQIKMCNSQEKTNGVVVVVIFPLWNRAAASHEWLNILASGYTEKVRVWPRINRNVLSDTQIDINLRFFANVELPITNQKRKWSIANGKWLIINQYNFWKISNGELWVVNNQPIRQIVTQLARLPIAAFVCGVNDNEHLADAVD